MDSFVVIHKPELSHIKFDYDFLQVVLDKSPVKLYQYLLNKQTSSVGTYGTMQVSIPGSSYMVNWYFYGTDVDTVTEMKDKTFKKVMSEMLADEPGTVAWIQDDTYILDNMDAVLNDYKVRQAKRKKQQ
ncbi:hypothetical protein C8P68_101448 [Mucilaginibacter yixingensis]|uniref:Uncharacterized protein n=1 Tax=Mucilaginibacter yixingensis TaxID=1295612 RepID=A0A2T5JFQ1_9SPHI|nr:hypothetical protein [Mucilaginibacter yixingensis]PTR01214.1 hypothetical protein C8P68_101448 [Mucilaginibacter yixingensis]